MSNGTMAIDKSALKIIHSVVSSVFTIIDHVTVSVGTADVRSTIVTLLESL